MKMVVNPNSFDTHVLLVSLHYTLDGLLDSHLYMCMYVYVYVQYINHGY